MSTYFTLVVFDAALGRYVPEFGDFDRDIVKQEQLDSYMGCRAAVLRSGPTQTEINSRVNLFNRQKGCHV